MKISLNYNQYFFFLQAKVQTRSDSCEGENSPEGGNTLGTSLETSPGASLRTSLWTSQGTSLWTSLGTSLWTSQGTSSVPDPNPDPPDPHVFGPPGSGSTSQRYGSGSGSGSFYYHATIVNLDSYYFVTLFYH
jgi:hypothetical protein